MLLHRISGEKTTKLPTLMSDPFAQSYANSSMSKCYRKHELDKKREYEERLEESSYAHLIPCLQLNIVRYATLCCLFWMKRMYYMYLAYCDELDCTYPISAGCGRSGPMRTGLHV
ncbi:hypothetical protein EMCRGX_G031443 [Ephydatia muelleri]